MRVGNGTGSMLVYFSPTVTIKRPADCKMGDVLKITGNVIPYNGFNQFKDPAVVELIDNTAEFTYPNAVEISGV